MFGNQYVLENLQRQKEKIDDMIKNYQQPQPVNNFINTVQSASRDLVEWRILNENEEVDNIYVGNKTLFISDSMMVLKGVDGKTEKWEVKKIYPVDKKDEKITQLEDEIKKLKEVIENGPTKFSEPIRDVEQSNSINVINVESKPKTNSKSISK